ncbi:MAG: hypothetical protein JW850_12745 [Thermoflexales bacterium]|nr:hypothetical protein [Thermoflexales bacterium]
METLQNDNLTVQIDSLLGGKIAQIVDRRTRRAWLSHHPRLDWHVLDAAELALPEPYGRLGDLGGWDECCPTVGSSHYPLLPYAGLPLVDHGECWLQQPEEQRDGMRIEHTWRGKALPFELRRRIELDCERPHLALSYTLRSLSDERLALLWSAHPLVAIEAGMRLELAEGTRMTINSEGSPLGSPGTSFEWPLCGTFDLSLITPQAAWYAKMFSEILDPGEVSLLAPSGERLRLSWSSGQRLLRLGLWLNYNGCSGDGGDPLQVVGLEPCVGATDALEDAVAEGTALVLEPGGQRDWQVWVDVTD